MEPIRVPMRDPRAAWIGEGDLQLSATDLPRIGRRFNLDIAEDVLARIPAEGLAAAVDDLGRRVAYRYEEDIQRVVHSFILDREWAEPIIMAAISEAVYRVISDMLTPTDPFPGTEQPHEL